MKISGGYFLTKMHGGLVVIKDETPRKYMTSELRTRLHANLGSGCY